MIKRKIQSVLADWATKFPVITITGPRQAGKTTLAQLQFPDYKYVNLAACRSEIFGFGKSMSIPIDA